MIGFIVFGLVVGYLARILRKGRSGLGMIATLGIGMAGSVIGGTIANIIGTGDIMELNVIGAVVAIIAAVFLIGIVEGIRGR